MLRCATRSRSALTWRTMAVLSKGHPHKQDDWDGFSLGETWHMAHWLSLRWYKAANCVLDLAVWATAQSS